MIGLSKRSSRIGVGMGLTVMTAAVVLVGRWLVNSRTPPSHPQPSTHETRSVVGAEVRVTPEQGGRLTHESGAILVVPPGAVKEPVAASVTPLEKTLGTVGAQRLIGPVYEVRLGDGTEQPREPVELTLPFTRDRLPPGADPLQLTVAEWTGREWRAVVSKVDTTAGTVTAKLLHLSPKMLLLSSRFTEGIAEMAIDPTLTERQASPRVPQGAVVKCRVPLSHNDRNVYTEVKVRGCEIFNEARGGSNGDYGPVQITEDANGVRLVEFTMRVPHDAELGPKFALITGGGPSGSSELTCWNAFTVCRPMVIIVDIDGMRQDVFYKALSDAKMGCPNLRTLVGEPKGDSGKDQLRWAEFQRGVALHRTTTIFPTVTFAGHAAIFSGSEPGALRMAGNEWFDRVKVEKYAFTGDNLGPAGYGPGDSHDSFANGRANDRLLAGGGQTLYEEARDAPSLQSRSIVLHNMYFGDRKRNAAAWWPQGLINEALYVPVPTTHRNDWNMAAKAASVLTYHDPHPNGLGVAELPGVNSGPLTLTVEENQRLQILTMYYAGLDHTSHEGFTPSHVEDRDGQPGRQQIYLSRHVDPSLGYALGHLSDVMYKHTTIVFTADHGQTTMAVPTGPLADIHHFGRARSVPTLHKFQDILWESGYTPFGIYGVAQTRPWVNQVQKSTAVLGLNGGMAHVYLRQVATIKLPVECDLSKVEGNLATILSRADDGFATWSEAPHYEQVEAIAERYRKWSVDGWVPQGSATDPTEYRNSLALILVRDAQHGGYGAAYQVYVGPGKVEPFLDYLKKDLAKNGDQSFLSRNGWTSEADAEFLAGRLRALQSEMSGDLILLPDYPKFYLEYKPQHGDHGSMNRTDFEIPFVVARPGASDKDMDAIKQVIARSVKIDDQGKNRPMNTDVKETVLNLLRLRPPTEEPAPPLAKGLQIALMKRVDIEKMRDFPSHIAAIQISSEALHQLDPKNPGMGIGFALYRSESPNGPFVRVPQREFFARTALIDGKPGQIVPVAGPQFLQLPPDQRKAILFDTDWPANNRRINKPYFYQIGQVPVQGEKADGASEVRSNIVGTSGKAVIEVATARTGEPVGISLVLEDQRYYDRKLHATVKIGSWTGHFFAANPGSGPQAVDSIGLYKITDSGTLFWLPYWGDKEVTAQIQVQGERYQAGGTFKLADADPENARSNRVRADENLGRDRDYFVGRERARLKEYEGELARVQDEIRKRGPNEDLLKSRKNYEERIAHREKVRIPMQEAYVMAMHSRAIGEHRAALALALERRILLKRDIAQRKKDNDVFDIAKDLYENERFIASLAFASADVGAYLSARLEQIQLSLTEGPDGPSTERLHELLYETATQVLQLTGNRGEAAAFYRWAQQVSLQNFEPERRVQVQAEMEKNPPYWWPGGNIESIAPIAPTAADLKHLDERLKALLPNTNR